MKTVRQKITMNDIARRLGISKNAVSLALNNKSGVSDELRKRVVEVASQLNYGGFRMEDKPKSNCIIAIVPEYICNDTFFYSDVFWAVEKETRSRGCIYITESITREAEENLLLPAIPHEMNILGFLVIGVVKEKYLQKLTDTGLRVLTVDISYKNVPVNSITSANTSGAYNAVKYLIDNGHKKIGFVGPIFTAQSIFDRWSGFTQAMMENHLEPNAGCNILGSDDHFELLDTADVLQPYIDKISSFPTAWFCAGDRIAIALMGALSRKDIKVPGDISIVGFDDIEASRMVTPPLTTIRVDRKLMGKMAVDCLVDGKTDNTGIFIINLMGKLIIRDSVRKIDGRDHAGKIPVK